MAIVIGPPPPPPPPPFCDTSIVESTPTALFVDHQDGTVTDTQTGLTWKRCAEGQTWSGGTCSGTAAAFTWRNALLRAKAVNDGGGYGGKTDWRVPNIHELFSLVEDRCFNPAINSAVFPRTPADSFWSSSPYGYTGARYASFYNGSASGSHAYDEGPVRLVRGGQAYAAGPFATVPAVTALASNANPSALGQNVTFTATVTGNTPTGTVTFTDGATALCSAVPLASGQAQCATTALGTGVHAVAAAYSGDVNNPAGTPATLSQSVNGGTPVLQGAVSRKLHGAATFDLPLSLTATNPATEPRAGPTATVAVTFDKPITGAIVAVTEGVASPGAPAFIGNDVVVNLTGVANAQYVTLLLTGVTSADGGSGGTASVRIGFLLGDVNASRGVTLSDLLAVNAVLTQQVTAANFLRDVDCSGTVSLADKLLVNANLTQSLPPP